MKQHFSQVVESMKLKGRNHRLQHQDVFSQKMSSSGFSLIELLVVIAIVGILLAMAVPAVQNSRASARRIQCQNHLRQLGISLQNYESQYGHLPKDAENGWGVGVFLLPNLDQLAIFDQLSPQTQKLVAGSPVDPETTGKVLPAFRCPSFAGGALLANGFGRSNYLGTEELFSEENRLTDIYDGESSTIAFGETTIEHAWALPGTGSCDSPPNRNGSYGSMHANGANFLICDGSVRLIANDIDQKIFQALCTLDGRETVSEF